MDPLGSDEVGGAGAPLLSKHSGGPIPPMAVTGAVNSEFAINRRTRRGICTGPQTLRHSPKMLAPLAMVSGWAGRRTLAKDTRWSPASRTMTPGSAATEHGCRAESWIVRFSPPPVTPDWMPALSTLSVAEEQPCGTACVEDDTTDGPWRSPGA